MGQSTVVRFEAEDANLSQEAKDARRSIQYQERVS